jgi:ribonuclease P protein component
MLSKKKRVTKSIFQTIIKEGKIFSTPLFSFYYKKNDFPGYVFVAPKNIFKTAVKRNRYRRIGYNILRFIALKPGFGIFIYKRQAILATPKEIKETVLFTLQKTDFVDKS